MHDATRVVIVVNPIAGGGEGPHRAAETESLLAAAGRRCERVVTRAAGDAECAAAEAAAAGVGTVLVVGGDGTINEVIQGLIRSETALAVLPLGTANVLAHELKLGEGPRSAARVILNGRRRRLDLGRVNGRCFICMASVGFDAYVTEHMAKWRRGSISYLSYIGPTLGAFWDYPYRPLRVRVDGVELKRPAYHVVVGNARSYGGPFSMTPNAKPDDGLLDAAVFGAPGHAMLALYMAATTVHLHHRLPSVEMLRGRRIEVEAEEAAPLQLDGDFRGYAPAAFDIVPRAITVLQERR